jgi:hypothetical protein
MYIRCTSSGNPKGSECQKPRVSNWLCQLLTRGGVDVLDFAFVYVVFVLFPGLLLTNTPVNQPNQR